MAARLSGADIQNQLNILSMVGVVGDLTDAHLLERFLSNHDGGAQAAFTALVERHGPMVLGVCREVLGGSADAQDAFQATFLVLLRKAGSVRNADSVASWLHGVAFRVARRAKTDAFRRRAYERQGAEMRALRNHRGADRADASTELHEEIARLPVRFREPVVLCYLEGLTTEAVAQRLRCPKGTILSRLSRGRERLRDRLTRRGLAPAPRLVTETLPSETAPARVPGPLLSTTVQLASQFLDEPATAELVSASVVSLTEGVLQAMFWTKLKAGGLVGLALVSLIVSTEAALVYQETKKEGRRTAPAQSGPKEHAPPIVRPADAVNFAGSSSPFIVSLPPREDLHRLLRRASSEAVVLAKAKPGSSSWTLTTIATAQAKAGDLDGARATFADAAREAEGDFGGAASSWNLWRVGHFQAECGLKDEARTTLQGAVKALPGVVGDYQKDSRAVDTFAVIAQEQSAIGAREDARKTVELLLVFSQRFFETTNIGNARARAAPTIATALAAVGDFEAAFAWTEAVQNSGNVLGKIAEAASKSLHPIAARRFVREAAGRLAKMELADQTYFGLSDLAEAQARLGDVEAAKRSAKAIGEGPLRVTYDMTDGQPYALVRVAGVQHQAGDTAGARETLRDAFRSVRDHPMMRGRDGRYSQIIGGQIANGDIDGAMQSMAEMEGQRLESLAFIARAQAAAGEFTTARATFARALHDAGLSVKNPPAPNPELKNQRGVSQNMATAACMHLAEIQAMVGDIPDALKTLRTIDDQNWQRSALQKVVSARAAAGDVAGALRLCLDESKTPEERRSALEGLGSGVDTRLSFKVLEPRAK